MAFSTEIFLIISNINNESTGWLAAHLCACILFQQQICHTVAIYLVVLLVIIINNYKTSIVPISSNRIKLSGAPSGGVGQTPSLGTMQSSSTMIRWKGNLGRISESE